MSLWIDSAAQSETHVKRNARTAAHRALTEALTGRPEVALHDLVDRRETITHPSYTGA